MAATVEVISRAVLPKTGRTRLMVGRRLSRDAIRNGPMARGVEPPTREEPAALIGLLVDRAQENVDLICASSSAMFWLFMRAATSATWGITIKVPL